MAKRSGELFTLAACLLPFGLTKQLVLISALIGLPNGFALANQVSQAVAISSSELKRATKAEAILATPCNVNWQGVPVAKACEQLARFYGVTVWLDRRIDPTLPIDATGQMELRTLLASIVEQASQLSSEPGQGDWGYSVLPDVAYLGPQQAAAELRTVAARAGANRLRKSTKPLAWQSASEPRQVIRRLIETHGLQVEDLEQVPHDLWRAGQLPAMRCEEQLTLLLLGFDLEATITGEQTIQIAPIKRPAAVAVTHGITASRTPDATTIAQAFPAAELAANQRSVKLIGTIEQQIALQELLSGRRRMPPKPAGDSVAKPKIDMAQLRFTLRVKNQPVGPLLKQLAGQVGLEFQNGGSLTENQGKRISFAVENATLEQLLAEIGKQADLQVVHDAKSISLQPEK